jgi:hypothetical protein
MEIYGAVLGPIQKNMSMAIKMKKASRPEKTLAAMKEGKGIDMSDPNIADEFTRFMKETDPEGSKVIEQTVELANFDPKKVKGNAEGGRIGFQEGGLPGVDPRMNLDYETLVEQNVDKRLQNPNFLNNIQGVKGTEASLDTPVDGLRRGPYTGKDYGPGNQPYTAVMPQEGMRYVYDEQGTRYQVPKNQPTKLEDYLSGYEEYKSNNPNKYIGTQALISAMLPGGFDYTFRSGAHANHFNDYLRSIGLSPYKKYMDESMIEKFNQGGRAGFYTGGITDVEPRLDDIGHGSDSLMSRTRLMSPGAQATTSTGLNYLLAEDNDNLRIPFSAGGDPRRRAFLKLLATLTGGAAALKTGILGLGEGTAKKAVTETVKQSAGNYPPPYFFKLVEKIKFMGDDITEKAATKDREIVKRYKDFEMTEDVATGDIVIKKRNEGSFYDQDGIVSDEYIIYKPGMADETTKGRKPPPEYEEYTVRPDAEGKLKDSEGGLDSIDEILEEVGDVDSMTLKKADGGRIGFRIGGSPRKFLERVFGKEKFKTMIDNDPELEQGMLEVVGMFRAKDKSGLVEYMQKFLPQMSKKEIEDFVVGSGDISGIEGQLIRLGSGRDYKSKLDMIEEANNIRKLENFDIDGVSKNAEGGRIEMKGGGDALKALIRYYANKKGVKGSTFLKDINPKTLPEGLENILGPEQLKALQKNQTDYVQSLLNIIKSDKNFLDNLKANTDEAIAQAPIGMEAFAKEITESIKKDAMKGSRFDRFKVYDKIDINDAIVDVEQMIKNRRVKESDGRALNASGGLTTMLGE